MPVITFREWLVNDRLLESEQKAKDAIMGVLNVDPDKADDIMGRKTTYFGSGIRKRLKELGVVKAVGEKYGNLVRGIEDGMTIAELIRTIS